MKQTAVEWLIQELEEQIRKSAHNELDTKRTGDYRIGLTKAIEFCEQAKQMEKEQSYSEEDMRNAFFNGWIYAKDIKYAYKFPEAKKEWFEQFKKE